MRIAIVTNIPAPYRVPVYNQLAAMPGVELHVFYAKEREPDRNWDLPTFEHAHTFLKDRMYTRSGRFIHNNPDIFGKLKAFAPDVVITTGYNPTHLYAFTYTLLHPCRHVAMTDGTDQSEAGLSRIHGEVRKFVMARTRAFVAASQGGRRLFHQYGIGDHKIHFSPLCANTSVDWSPESVKIPPLDLLFSGRLVEVKNAPFFLEVAHLAAQQLGRRVSVALLGSGPLEAALRTQATLLSDTVDLRFVGHVSQQDMPHWFLAAKLFLFPSQWDPWGIVANEACLAGLPVLVSPHAGVAGELVLDGVNGFVLPLEAPRWADAVVALLQDPAKRSEMASHSRRLVEPYSFSNAALGIENAARMSLAPHVLCVQRRLTHYRVALFEELRRLLAADGVVFDLVHGQPNANEASKNDEGKLHWATPLPCRYWLKGHLCWQNPGLLARNADIVVVTQENKMLYNLWAMFFRRPRRLAYWGHGRNFQSSKPDGVLEVMKRILARRCDWWFAYTGLSVRRLIETGFPKEKITNLQNAVDVRTLQEQCDAVTPEDLRQFRLRLQVDTGPVAIYVGSLYPEKRIRFLLQAGESLAVQVPGFVLVVIGNGPDRMLVERAARQHAWLRYEGTRYGADKAVALRAADVMLNPGLVGLGILDAFVAGIPLVTTDCGVHSPEIDYLRNGENGIMTANTLEAFVEAAASVLSNHDLALRLGVGARADAGRYTIHNMAQNFRQGLAAALALPAR